MFYILGQSLGGKRRSSGLIMLHARSLMNWNLQLKN